MINSAQNELIRWLDDNKETYSNAETEATYKRLLVKAVAAMKKPEPPHEALGVAPVLAMKVEVNVCRRLDTEDYSYHRWQSIYEQVFTHDDHITLTEAVIRAANGFGILHKTGRDAFEAAIAPPHEHKWAFNSKRGMYECECGQVTTEGPEEPYSDPPLTPMMPVPESSK